MYNQLCHPPYDTYRLNGITITIVVLILSLVGMIIPVQQLDNITIRVSLTVVLSILTVSILVALHITRVIDPHIVIKQQIDTGDSRLVQILNDAQHGNSPITRHVRNDDTGIIDTLHYCRECSIWRSSTTFHCYTCNYCVVGFDHHCGVIGACIGEYNHRFFTLFLLLCGISGTLLLTADSIWLIQLIHSKIQWNTSWQVYVCIVLIIFYSEASLLLIFGVLHSILMLGNSSSKLKFGSRKQPFNFNLHQMYNNLLCAPIQLKHDTYVNDIYQQQLSAV